MLKQTPLIRAVEDYIKSDWTRFHMPGHKGTAIHPIGNLAAYDMTEVDGLDSLFEEGEPGTEYPIKELEAQFTQLYGSKRTVLSAGGSTLCIQAMLKLVGKLGSKIIAGRNIHIAAVNAMALLELDPIWVYPKQGEEDLSGQIAPEQIEKALLENKNKDEICAVYITSPDYFGIISDIGEIAKICHKYDVPLLVDNAHGAHLKFLGKGLHPIDQGADLCCDSLHKTLPALTGAAALHCGNVKYSHDLKSAMSTFGSTSPNYLILLSCESVAVFLQNEGEKALQECMENCNKIRCLAEERGFNLPKHCEAMRLTLPLCSTNYDAKNFKPILRRHKIMEEYLNDSACVLLISPLNSKKDFTRLENFLMETCPKQNTISITKKLSPPLRVVGLRQAVFAPKVTVKIDDAKGKIAAQVKSPCPPGIPLIMPGEVLHKDEVEMLKLYGIFSIDVLK